MIKFFDRRKLLLVSSVLLLGLTVTSCEPLRKKFTRKKKHPQAEDRNFTPVLAPEEYPAPEDNPVDLYKQHYELIKAWYTDLWTLLQERNMEKRALYVLKQITEHLDGMEKVVQPPSRVELAKLRGFLAYYREAMGAPAAQRNVSRIQSDLRAFHRLLTGKLTPSKMKGSLLTVK